MGKILITRPRDKAREFAAIVKAGGYDPLIAPATEIVVHNYAPFDILPDALVVTSASGFGAVEPAMLDIPVFAVGPVTAETAKDLGFKTVYQADGDARSLLALVRSKAKSGALIGYLRGQHIAHDLSANLNAAGFKTEDRITYSAHPARGLSPKTIAALRTGQVEAIAFFSRRTAGIFCDLVRKAGLKPYQPHIKYLCISPDVVECVRIQAQYDDKAQIFAAHTPDRKGMVGLISEHCTPVK